MQKMTGAEFAELQQMQCARELVLRQDTAKLEAEIERLRTENIKVSRHCADLIQAMRDYGMSDESIKRIAADVHR